MIIGTVKEIKNNEYRVGLTPASVREYIAHGHTVYVQTGAGMGVGETDDYYRAAGATILDSAEEVFYKADMIIKVKEPLAEEVPLLRENQILYTYLHLASSKELTIGLQKSGAICIAYETVTSRNNDLPLLVPMSEVAGRMSIQLAARFLEKENGGKGQLLGGIAGVNRGNVVIIGGGVAGSNAALIALGMGARVTIIDRSMERLRILDQILPNQTELLYATSENIHKACEKADVVVGAVLIPGAGAPKLLTRTMLCSMEAGSVVVDIAIDQGGCFETSRPTTHENPIFIEENIIHYCVTNIPGAVAKTATYALNNVTLQYGLSIANYGAKKAMEKSPYLLEGLNVSHGHVTHQAVAEALELPHKDNPLSLFSTH